MNKKSLAGPRALTIIGSLAMLVSLVLPYATSSNDTMTAFTIAERWKEMQSVANMSVGVSEIILVMTLPLQSSPCWHSSSPLPRKAFRRLSLSFSPILAYVYFNLSFTPYGSYGFGFGVYLFYVAAIAVIAGSIWMIAIKRHNKAAIPNM